MSVEIDPVELGFHRMLIFDYLPTYTYRTIGPFTSEVSQILKIRNTNHTPVAFKVRRSPPTGQVYRALQPNRTLPTQVKTTAPKQYVSNSESIQWMAQAHWS